MRPELCLHQLDVRLRDVPALILLEPWIFGKILCCWIVMAF